MATTGIWKITTRLDKVINYVTNIEKTINKSKDNSSYLELHNFKEYADLDFNSETTCYITGINCLSDKAYKDMQFTKKSKGKENGILGFHAFQSFKDGEVTPDKAHLIGIKLAEEMWGDRFEVVVATHTNTKHIHNHFVINSVSFKDGKKYYDNRENYAKLRHLSDTLCQEHGLSVLEEKECKSGINYSNYYKSLVSKTNYHIQAKEDLDRAIGMAYSFTDFENLMKRMGYEVIERYGKLSIRREPFKKNIRIERSLGSEYSISEIEKRIANTHETRVPFIEEFNPYKKKIIYEKAKKQKSKGLYGLYKYYCYILKVYPRHYPRKILSPELRLEIKKMDEISEQTKLLVGNKIETYEQLLFYKNSLSNELSDLVKIHNNLWNKIKSLKDENEKLNMRNQIDVITNLITEKKKGVKVCESIEKRIEQVEINIKKFEEEKGKEKDKNEFKRIS